MKAEDAEKARQLWKFDENDPAQHMMKVMFGCGIFAGFRGSTEHANFNIAQVTRGIYPDKYEDRDLAGVPYVAISNFQDKTNKLSIHKSYLRDTSHILRFPVLAENKADFGGALVRLVGKMSPGQTRIYCFPASDQAKSGFQRAGYPTASFYADKPLGYKSISKYMKEGAKILGLPTDFRPHSLRSAYITCLANDPSVSTKEVMIAGRHSSTSASAGYMRPDGISEGNRLRALGCAPDKKASQKVEEKVESSPLVEVKKEEVKTEENTTAGLKTTGLEDPLPVPYGDDEYNVGLSQEEWSMLELEDALPSSDSDDSSWFEPIELKGRKNSLEEDYVEVPSMTQVGIEELKDDLAELKEMMEEKPKKKKSQNQIIIGQLKEQVNTLKRKLEAREADELYKESLEVAAEKELEAMTERFMRERSRRKEVEKENKEYEQFYESRFPRSGPKRKLPKFGGMKKRGI